MKQFEDIDNPKASWVIRYKGEIMVRDKGKVLYQGPEVDMPQEIAEIVKEFNYNPTECKS
jgi:hypothetical protein